MVFEMITGCGDCGSQQDEWHRGGAEQSFDGAAEVGLGTLSAVGAAENDEVDIGFGDLGKDVIPGEVAFPNPVALPDTEAGEPS
jgi:hypothetical protein